MQIIPSIDLLAGKCVRLVEGDFTNRTEYEATPLELAVKYAASGAKQLHLVDLDGARTGCFANLDAISEINALGVIETQAGGGVRTLGDVKKLLGAGCTRVVVGSMAVRDPDTVCGWARELGPEKFCIALDLRDGVLATEGWQDFSDRSLVEILEPLFESGLRRFLCTDIRKDGKLAGPNLDLYAELANKHPEVEWIASGGVTTEADLLALGKLGIYGAVIGKALYQGNLKIQSWQVPKTPAQAEPC